MYWFVAYRAYQYLSMYIVSVRLNNAAKGFMTLSILGQTFFEKIQKMHFSPENGRIEN
jgi:hypothetical protein